MSQENVEIVRKVSSTANRGDMDALRCGFVARDRRGTPTAARSLALAASSRAGAGAPLCSEELCAKRVGRARRRSRS